MVGGGGGGGGIPWGGGGGGVGTRGTDPYIFFKKMFRYDYKALQRAILDLIYGIFSRRSMCHRVWSFKQSNTTPS